MFPNGSSLGSYTIDRHLGSGSFGNVYKAIHADDGTPVAIKVTRTENPEAEILGRLNHPAIPSVVEQFRDGRLHVTVLQYTDGVSLAEVLGCIHSRQHRKLRVRDAFSQLPGHGAFHSFSAAEALINSPEPFIEFGIRLVQQICSALHHAHRNDICHRDVKPENVLIDTTGRAILIDWGTAVGSNTETDGSCGTPGYMHPWLLSKAGGIDTVDSDDSSAQPMRHDLYAVGILLHEVVTGKLPIPPPAENASIIAQARELLAAQPAMKNSITHHPAIPTAVKTIICLCTGCGASSNHPDPAYANLQQVEEDLGRYASGHAMIHAGETAVMRIERFQRRHRFAIQLLMLTVALVLAAVGMDRYRVYRHLSRWDQQRKEMTQGTKTAGARMSPEQLSSVFEIGLFPDSASVRKRRADVAHGLAAVSLAADQPKQAAQLLEQAVLLDPHNGSLHNDLGTACFQLRRFDDAIAAFNQALSFDCDHAAVLSNRGAAFASIGKTKDARRDFLKAIERNPDHKAARRHLDLLNSPDKAAVH